MTDAKFKLEDILNKQKAPPQILDLVHIKIETEEEYKNVIEKIPDYKIKPERVRHLLCFIVSYSPYREPCKKTTVSKKLLLGLKRTTVFHHHVKKSIPKFQKNYGFAYHCGKYTTPVCQKNYCLVSKKLWFCVKKSTFCT